MNHEDWVRAEAILADGMAKTGATRAELLAWIKGRGLMDDATLEPVPDFPPKEAP